jgi:hypothetical protein
MNRLAGLALMTLLACNRSSDNGFAGASSPVLPVAIAGDDIDVAVGTAGALSGSKSFDPGGGPMAFLWEQLAGTTVALSDPTAPSPTFTAPGAPEALTFRLTVTGAQGSDADEVTVNVKAVVVTAPDTWFAGYGTSGTITAAVAGGTAPFTYEWTGIEAWLTASGASTATLAYTTPALTDLQNFPDRAEAAMLEKTTQGRLQLKVKVTDATGATDEDLVNFSAGPCAVTMVHENVALGEPVYLNGALTTTGGAVTSWTWAGTKPTGAAVSFLKPDKTALAGATDQRFVYFVPDLVGAYEVIVTQAPGPVAKVINITCGKYVGVGSLLGKTPDPFKGECAACHAGQLGWLADFANPWRQTGHARMFSALLDPASPYHAAVQAKGRWNDAFNFGSSYSIDSRTTGFTKLSTACEGFAKHAADEGFVLAGATWEEMKRKHPKTAGMANVQCEACHGPGSEHAGDTTAIRKSYDANLCGRCHSRKQDLWEASGHGKPPLTSASGSASCNGCHTAQGFVVEMRKQEGADPHAALFAVSDINRPVIPYEDRRGTTCSACHEPHKRTAKMNAAGKDPQLRAYGGVRFRNSAVAWMGEAAVCAMCHQSRTDTTAGSNEMNIRRAPHDSTASEMLAGTNAVHFAGWTYSVSPHGQPARFIAPGKTMARQCLSCHADVQPAKGQAGYNAIGGHTFAVRQGTGAAIATQATHAGGATAAGAKTFTVASGPSFLKSVFAGDLLTITAGADLGTYTVSSVDSARQLTLSAAAAFAGGPATAWTITSTVKYNTAACTQCHTVALDLQVAARGDYDGDGTVESVQGEIAGLEAAVLAAVNAKLAALVGPGTTMTVSSGRIKYDKLGTGTLRTFPGPGVTASDNPDLSWSGLTLAQQAEWLACYQAAYNYQFVVSDHSDGIHNTGYAVNVLQSAVKAVTGAAVGQPFVPFP